MQRPMTDDEFRAHLEAFFTEGFGPKQLCRAAGHKNYTSKMWAYRRGEGSIQAQTMTDLWDAMQGLRLAARLGTVKRGRRKVQR